MLYVVVGGVVVYTPTKVRNFKQITTKINIIFLLLSCLYTYKGKKF